MSLIMDSSDSKDSEKILRLQNYSDIYPLEASFSTLDSSSSEARIIGRYCRTLEPNGSTHAMFGNWVVNL